jgi:sugar lactone lactonase YvrE
MLASAIGWLLGGCAAGVAPAPVTLSAPAVPRPHSPARGGSLQELAITEYTNNSIQIFNRKYQIVSTITSGVSGPIRDWYDARTGALYVANSANGTVTEYAKGSSSGSFTYSSGLKCPYDVKTDKRENVYVVDGCAHLVAEYPQGINRISAQCSTGASGNYPHAVAIDSSGNVYVGLQFSASGMGQVQTYLRQSGALSGLVGCRDQSLVTLGNPGCLLFDDHGNMIACDEGYNGYPPIPPNVDILPPPYTSISQKLGGFKGPVGAALDEKQKTLYVADRTGQGVGDVKIVSYPGDSLITTLGASENVTNPWGVAAYPISKSSGPPSATGVIPASLSRLHVLVGARLRPARSRQRGANDLYVSDLGTSKVEILKNGRWEEIGEISSGIQGPDGDYVDSNRNFYIANYLGPNIEEYKPATTQPSFTYKSGMKDPVDVSADAQGNVYEADYNGAFVAEYAQGQDSVINACFPGGNVEGVAIDSSNDVFVAYNTKNEARIAEYPGGLSGCHKKLLGVKLQYAGGIAVDNKGNLIACDQAAVSVDVIAPPYTTVSATLGSGFESPFHVTLNRKNTLVFVADVAWGDVQVLAYPGGASVADLGTSNGIQDATGAVDGENAVY